ncbi:MAG: hypothetical protein H6736_15820 [Alphaproteobacteria bacterium]|nr:hypothetical protein [Alphaproteobacteria bacterium]MCB9693279.1 hypothetical protein [Alphaproteobacteria bacterium]
MMLMLLLLPAFASEPSVDPDEAVLTARQIRRRVDVPPFDVTLGGLGRSGSQAGGSFGFGVEPVRVGMLSVRTGLSTTTFRDIDGMQSFDDEVSRDPWGWRSRTLRQVQSSLWDGSLIVRPQPWIGVEAVAGVRFMSFRQQWTRIQGVVTPSFGGGLVAGLPFVGVRLRVLADAIPVVLHAEDGQPYVQSPVTTEVAVYGRWPGTRGHRR